MRTLIVSSLGQLAESVAGTGQVESGLAAENNNNNNIHNNNNNSPGLAADMTHWPEDSEKVNEVQLLPGDLKHRLAHPIGFVSTFKQEYSLLINMILLAS